MTSSSATNGTDCLECRLTGSAALTGISCFLLAQRKHQTTRFGRVSVSVVAASTAVLALSRAFNLPPFNKNKT